MRPGSPANEFDEHQLVAMLASLGMPPEGAAIAVALSGGADSAALLAALQRALKNGFPARVRALHVDHGLRAGAALRAAAAQAATQLGVAFQCLEVVVPIGAGRSLEAEAREVRYAALRAALQPDEWLLTAHHQDDQAETLFLQLLRGAGVKGLAAMPGRIAFGAGWLARPLLTVPAATLRSFAEGVAVAFHDDPMNADTQFDRVYLRRVIWPLLRARWPQAGTTIARAASHLGAAQTLLDAWADQQLIGLARAHALSLQGLRRLTPIELSAVLRRYLASRGLPMPPSRRLATLCTAIRSARADAAVRVAWPGAEVRLYREGLYAGPPLPAAVDAGFSGLLSGGHLVIPGLGHVVVCGGDAAALAMVSASWRLTPRQGGERLRLAPGGARRSLKDVLRELGVPPWTRERSLLVWQGAVLVAVLLPGRTLADADGWAVAGDRGLSIHWEGAPEMLFGVSFVEETVPFR